MKGVYLPCVWRHLPKTVKKSHILWNVSAPQEFPLYPKLNTIFYIIVNIKHCIKCIFFRNYLER